MTTQEVVMALCNGNPGAISVLSQLIKLGQLGEVDPENANREWCYLLALDELDLYGDAIWLLYSDICNRDIIKTAAALRAFQLGLVAELEIESTINFCRTGTGKNWLKDVDFIKAVQNLIPSFNAIANVV